MLSTFVQVAPLSVECQSAPLLVLVKVSAKPRTTSSLGLVGLIAIEFSESD